MSYGSAKDGKHSVPHEFLNPTTKSLHVLTDLPVVHHQTGTNIFGIRLCSVCGEADEIHEEDRYDFTFLEATFDLPIGNCGLGSARWAETRSCREVSAARPAGLAERGSTARAEPRTVGSWGTAGWANIAHGWRL